LQHIDNYQSRAMLAFMHNDFYEENSHTKKTSWCIAHDICAHYK